MTTDKQKEWDAAAAEAAAHQDAGDPPPKRFREKLPCTLTKKEQLATGLRYADAVDQKARHVVQTKSMMAVRRAELTKLDEAEKTLADAFRTGRIEQEVDVSEHVSLRLGRKWKVRRDTGETYDERPLTSDERQGKLPIDDGQLPLRAVDEPIAGGVPSDGDEDDGADEEVEDDDGEGEIDDPERLLDEATDEQEAP